MAKNLFNDWLDTRNASNGKELEDYIARQIPIVKGETDNLKKAKDKMTYLINVENYKTVVLDVSGGNKTRPELNNPETLNKAYDYAMAKVKAKDKDFLSKVITVTILKEMTGMDEKQLVDAGLCCISAEQYTFKVPKN